MGNTRITPLTDEARNSQMVFIDQFIKTYLEINECTVDEIVLMEKFDTSVMTTVYWIEKKEKHT